MTDKLTETFGLPPSENDSLLKELEERYNYSDNPELKDIIHISLNAYKEMMLDMMNFEPRFRARQSEVAQSFLALAKDAMVKDTELRLKEEKQNEGKKDDDEPKGEGETFDRDEFLVELKNAGKKA